MIPINSFIIACQKSNEQIFLEITTFNDDLIHNFEAYYNVDFPNDVKFLKSQDKPEGLHDNLYCLYIQVKTSQVADLISNNGNKIERNYVVKSKKMAPQT